MQSKVQKKVQVILFQNQDLILLKTVQERGGFWQSITGGVEEGESYFEAAGRELFEEVALNSPIFETGYSFQFNVKEREVHEAVFFVELHESDKVQISWEHEESKKIEINSVKEQDFGYPSSYLAFLNAKKRREEMR